MTLGGPLGEPQPQVRITAREVAPPVDLDAFAASLARILLAELQQEGAAA